MKVKTSKGFTLAELLIVMAIIVVLAAVAIPTFGKQLETARETGDMEIIRNAYTDALSIAVQDGADGSLNGYFGKGAETAHAAATASDTDFIWGAVSWQGAGEDVTVGTGQEAKTYKTGKYQVLLNKTSDDANAVGDPINTHFSQNTASHDWKYVFGELMGSKVPNVDTTKKQVTFTFYITPTGEVKLAPDTVSGTTVTNVGITTNPDA